VVFGAFGPITDTSLQAQGRRYRQVGRQDDGSIVVTTNQALTPAGRHVEFRGVRWRSRSARTAAPRHS
jgi:hypothetical protein